MKKPFARPRPNQAVLKQLFQEMEELQAAQGWDEQEFRRLLAKGAEAVDGDATRLGFLIASADPSWLKPDVMSPALRVLATA